MADPITNWIDARIKAAVDEAIQAATAQIVAEMRAAEKNVVSQIALLPGLLGSQIHNVAVDAGAIATSVVNGVLQGIPNILNPFKGPRQ